LKKKERILKSMQAIKRKEENDDEEILYKVYKIIKRDLLTQEVYINKYKQIFNFATL